MISLLRNQKVRNTLLQVLYVGALATLVIVGVLTARQNLAAQGITSGFSFLFKQTGWNVNFSLLPAAPTDPYQAAEKGAGLGRLSVIGSRAGGLT